ncbi:MAG: helix-turn-helix transcriptional regulator [Acidobacteria bacterium]|nr:helix-turn-helix transcriptional regulator [Acidobacteriota bacterium]
MITNARQYRITKAQAEKFRQALEEFDYRPSAHAADVHPRLIRAQREAIASQLETLEQEIEEYERLQKSRRRHLDLEQIAELPESLIRARIAAGLSQRELAKRLGLKEQQIQRYEATKYESASLKRVLEVARALTAQAA